MLDDELESASAICKQCEINSVENIRGKHDDGSIDTMGFTGQTLADTFKDQEGPIKAEAAAATLATINAHARTDGSVLHWQATGILASRLWADCF
eukprot:SAG11_NODE_26605_length_343_cov_0.635246_1_plen_94_part_01